MDRSPGVFPDAIPKNRNRGARAESASGALTSLHFAMEAYLVMFGAGMAGGIRWQTVGWLFSLAKRRAARMAAGMLDSGTQCVTRADPTAAIHQERNRTVKSGGTVSPGPF